MLCKLGDISFILQSNSRWDRYLGMTAAMTQVPVPTAIHIGGVKVAYVEARQTRTVIEHESHIRYLGRIKVAHVKTCQDFTKTEHLIHIRHISGIQMLNSRNGRKHTTFVEPKSRARQFRVAGKRLVKDHRRNG